VEKLENVVLKQTHPVHFVGVLSQKLI